MTTTARHFPSGHASVASQIFALVQPQPGATHSPRPRFPSPRQWGQVEQIADRIRLSDFPASGNPRFFHLRMAARRDVTFAVTGGEEKGSPRSGRWTIRFMPVSQ